MKNSSEDLLKKFAIKNNLPSKSSSTVVLNNPQIYVNSNNSNTNNSLVLNSQLTGNNIITPAMFNINEEDEKNVDEFTMKKYNGSKSS